MKRAILSLILSAVSLPAASPVKIVLVAGRPSHGPGAHEFNAGMMLLEKMLKQNKDIEPVIVKGGWPADEAVLEGARSIFFYLDGGGRHPFLEGKRLQTLRQLMDKGVGFGCMHYCVEIPKENGGAELLEWLGGYYERPYSTNPINEVEVTPGAPKHEISRGWKSFVGRDEWYYRIRFRPDDPRVTPILTTRLPKDEPKLETIAWATQRGNGGRSFGFTGGHFHTNWGLPDFRRMVVNAMLWTAKVNVPRNGAKCELSAEDLTKNLDPKPPPQPKKKQ